MNRIYRHENNKGSVIPIDMYGTRLHLFIPDAKYRPDGLRRWYSGDSEQETLEIPHVKAYLSRHPNDTLFDGSLELKMLSDIELQYRAIHLSLDNTAKENTDILMKSDEHPAAKACRDTDAGLGPMDLPNAYEMMVIFQYADIIDSMDPTFEEYKYKGLGSKSTYGHFNWDDGGGLWTSSMKSEDTVCGLHRNGAIRNTSPRSVSGVLPVREFYTLEDRQHNANKDAMPKVIDPLATRKVYRHTSGKGSVIEFNMFNKATRLFVPDSQYRPDFVITWGPLRQDIPELTKFNRSDMDISTEKNDLDLQHILRPFRDDLSAKKNTDILMKYETPAAHACRNIDIGLGPMDLPNIYELIVIFQESNKLGELDPSFKTIKTTGFWSSSLNTDQQAFIVDGNYKMSGHDTTDIYGIMPVLEL